MDVVRWSFQQARDQLAEALPRRWAHVQGVARRAQGVLPLVGADEAELLLAAAVLHDIGYSPLLASTGLHALDGALYLQRCGVDDRLCALVAHHSCAWREAQLRGLSAPLAVWKDEKTTLRDALWWADMTTTPDGHLTDVHSRLREIRERYGPDDVVTTFICDAREDLMAAVERTEDRLRAAGLGHLAK